MHPPIYISHGILPDGQFCLLHQLFDIPAQFEPSLSACMHSQNPCQAGGIAEALHCTITLSDANVVCRGEAKRDDVVFTIAKLTL